jgi:hypothetical protein
MAILDIQTDTAGRIGVSPRLIRIKTDDTVSAITATGYLNTINKNGFALDPLDMALVSTTGNDAQMYKVVKSGDDWSLVSQGGDTVLPTTANHFAIFTNTEGTLSDAAITAVNSGPIQAGLSGTAGTLRSYPSTAAKGSLMLSAVDSTGDFTTTISNGAMGQSTLLTMTDPGGATGSLLTTYVHAADVNENLVYFSVTCDQAALASAASITLQPSSGAKQYRVIELLMNSGGTNFSGGGGDRLGQVTDGTTIYSVTPAAQMQALVNARWGDTAMPFPASSPMQYSTVAGANLVFKYSGGTTDYTAGSVIISGTLLRVL